MRKAIPLLSLFTLFELGLFGQSSQRTAPRPQTARQALIEMIAGGQEAQFKHLTVEVQQEMSKPGGKAAAAYLTSLSGMVKGAGTDFKSLESGSVLFSFSDPKKNEKAEIQVDNDDLAGDQETFQLSLHLYEDGKEQDDEVMALSPKLSVEMKKQDDVWRLNNVMVSLNLPVGSPKLFQKMKQQKTIGAGLSASAGGRPATTYSDSGAEQPCCYDPQQMLQMLSSAELIYARENPQTGFTCSISELVDTNQGSGHLLDQSFFKGIAGGTANGFRFAITGCAGKPAGSYQITAEPASPNATPKAFCMDATQVIRTSDDGRGATCLTSGKTVSAGEGDEGMIGGNVGFSSVGVDVHQSKPQK